MAKVELLVSVESWELQCIEAPMWGRVYRVVKREWRKKMDDMLPPSIGLTMQPASQYGQLKIESVHYDTDIEIYLACLEGIRALEDSARMIEQELADDNWEPVPSSGDFGE